eukprot:CAMPEP_0171288018 /NCGR_PEP_ID=MMETSP0790-20130122/69881_1 /TAXON_ID=2925 /ORGANISM="Alexandrium catenella, Strain OF101" /LENGTH=46 /DNA_ID= /DNA_START= /DNA_END= /DNA_ORIENTATION=
MHHEPPRDGRDHEARGGGLRVRVRRVGVRFAEGLQLRLGQERERHR